MVLSEWLSALWWVADARPLAPTVPTLSIHAKNNLVLDWCAPRSNGTRVTMYQLEV